MKWFRVLRARWFAILHGSRFEAEMDEELRFHLAMRTRENIERGMPPEEASYRATARLGNVNRVKDAWRDVSGRGTLERFWLDVLFAARMLRKDRAFTIVAVFALAVGIGGSTAIFTLVRSVLLRPLPYPNAKQLMWIGSRDSRQPDHHYNLSYPDLVYHSFRRSVLIRGCASRVLYARSERGCSKPIDCAGAAALTLDVALFWCRAQSYQGIVKVCKIRVGQSCAS
jgi:hypothetical protein